MTKPTLDKLCEGFNQIYPAAITEILEEFGYRRQWLGPDIVPLHPEMKVSGPAFTMQAVNDPVVRDKGDEKERKKFASMVEKLQPNMVPIIEASACDDSGWWGELMCNLCMQKGIKGTVIDGGVRDALYIYKLGFNMFYKFSCPHEANSRARIINHQEPIFINGVAINPGDFIVAELGGVIVVPQDIVYDVYEKVQELLDKESETRRMILEGIPFEDILREQHGQI
jgi:4-hydroxy-4-methyl-2-oxoglutarate aldolase